MYGKIDGILMEEKYLHTYISIRFEFWASGPPQYVRLIDEQRDVDCAKRQNDDVETWGTRSRKMWCARIAIDICKNHLFRSSTPIQRSKVEIEKWK